MFEKFQRTLLSGHPLGQPKWGTLEAVISIPSETINGYWKRRYSPRSTVISVARNTTHAETVQLVDSLMGGWEGDETGRASQLHSPTRGLGVIERDIEQAHLAYGGGSVTRNDDRRWAVAVLSGLLGTGVHSRLNTTMGKEPGVASLVGSFSQSLSDAGSWMVYVGTTLRHVPEVMERIDRTLNDLVVNGVTKKELEGYADRS